MADTDFRDAATRCSGEERTRVDRLPLAPLPPCPPASLTRRRLELKWPCLALPLFALVALTQVGCVSRRLMVQSNPPGAMVLVEGKDADILAGRDSAAAAKHDRAIGRLLPVLAGWRQRRAQAMGEDRRCRRKGQHLSAHRRHPARQRWNELIDPGVRSNHRRAGA